MIFIQLLAVTHSHTT